MIRLFISSSSEDREIVAPLRDLLVLGIGLTNNMIYCTTLDQHGVPMGTDFNENIRKEMLNANLLLFVLSEAFLRSRYCLCEMGAAWVLDHTIFPLIVPPLVQDAGLEVFTNRQNRYINEDESLDVLRDQILNAFPGTFAVHTVQWNKQKRKCIQAINKTLRERKTLQSQAVLSTDNIKAGETKGSKLEITRYKLEIENRFFDHCTRCRNIVVRCRGGSSIFSVPYDTGLFDISNPTSFSFEEIELERKKLYMRFIERGFKLKYIITLSVDAWKLNNYTDAECITKLNALYQIFHRYAAYPNFNVAIKQFPDKQMYVLFHDKVAIHSTKLSLADGRSYDSCRISKDESYIKGCIDAFEDEYNAIILQNLSEFGISDINDVYGRNLQIMKLIASNISKLQPTNQIEEG